MPRWADFSPPAGHLVFAVLGAESTGKSTLAQALAPRIGELTGLPTVWVPEVLREWCDAAGRTPRREEQAGIAEEQARRIQAAVQGSPIVVCDTTPLMTAVYHRQVFGDRSLDGPALRWQRGCALSLLTAMDLPWRPDGLQRDGPQVRAPVDATLRELLWGQALPFSVVAGTGAARTDAALDAMARTLQRLKAPRRGLFTRLDERCASLGGPAPWHCTDCDSPECEHALLGLGAPTPGSLQLG